jgi:hypothetical protein
VEVSDEDRVTYWKRRARDAERCLEFEKEHDVRTREWAHRAFDDQRRLSDRCTYLYGLAVKHGATDEELRRAWPE